MLVISWPTYPTITKGGKLSKAKRAGRRLPWLSMNGINNLPRPVYHQLRGMWRDAAADECNGPILPWDGGPQRWPIRLRVQLFKATKHEMDASAVIEGCKPIVDGLVVAGVLPDDKPEFVRGIDVLPAVPVGLKGNTRVEVSWEEAV